ncbi:MAG TPA: hypothetical protein VND64_22270 [Pirellulales bacterium]|nr:hypothetical protein [Pirellulales bacterium]
MRKIKEDDLVFELDPDALKRGELLQKGPAKTYDQINLEAEEKGEPQAIACMPCSVGPAGIPGSTVKQCSACKTDVWMSPATEQMMGELARPVIVCVECLPALLDEAKQKTERS